MVKERIIEKYGKKFTGNSFGSTALEGIHYAENGNVYVTNRITGLRLTNVHKLPMAITLHAKTGLLIDGAFPSIDGVFLKNPDQVIAIDKGDLPDILLRVRCIADVAARLDKNMPVIEMSTKNKELHISTKRSKETLTCSTFLGRASQGEDSIRLLNAQYLHLALSVLQEAGNGAEIRLGKQHEPIYLTNGDGVDVAIMPFNSPKGG